MRLLALMAIGAALLPAIAVASDSKVYAGSTCVRTSGGTPVYSNSAIGNDSTTSQMFVDCPIIHDTIDSEVGEWHASVKDRHTAGAVGCQLIAAEPDNGFGSGAWDMWFGLSQETGIAAASTAWAFLQSTADSDSDGGAHYYLSCRIAPKLNSAVSFIGTYSVEEN